MTSLVLSFFLQTLQQLPVSIPANALRTRADSEWVVVAAAKALPAGSVLAVGTETDPRGDSARTALHDRQIILLGAVARSLGIALDTVPPLRTPPCASDRAGTKGHVYRIGGVEIKYDNRYGGRGRPEWFHLLVELQRMCRRGDVDNFAKTTVEFDAMPDTLYSFAWSVGQVKSDPDPPPPPPPSYSQKHGRLIDRVIKVIVYGALIFPVLGWIFGVLGGQHGLRILLGGWALLGIVLTLLAANAFLSCLVAFNLAPIAFVAAAARAEKAAVPALWRATAVFIVAYPLSFVIFWTLLWNGM